MLTNTPKDKIEDIIKTHDYKEIRVIKHKRDKGLYTVTSFNDLPQVIMEYVNDNYNMVFGSANRIEFYEHTPIGLETRENDFMI